VDHLDWDILNPHAPKINVLNYVPQNRVVTGKQLLIHYKLPTTLKNKSWTNPQIKIHVQLIQFAISKGLNVRNTTFPHKDIHKETWYSADSRIGESNRSCLD
jgi:hypothetical protein